MTGKGGRKEGWQAREEGKEGWKGRKGEYEGRKEGI